MEFDFGVTADIATINFRYVGNFYAG